MESFRRREPLEGFLDQPIVEEVAVRQAKPHKPGERHPEEHQQVQRREQSLSGPAPAFHPVEDQQHQRRNEEPDRPLDQRREARR